MTEAGIGVVRALVCEDEPLARKGLREYLRDVEWIEIVGEAENGREGLRLLHKLEPDLLFLDVRMPGMTGLELLDAASHLPAIVFTTAHDEYAVDAFELGAVDYLMKPFGKQRLLETLQRVRVRLVGEGLGNGVDEARPRGELSRIFARRRGAIVPIPVEDIVRVEAADHGTVLVTGRGEYDVDSTLGELAERLDRNRFVRVHRSHVVNLDHVVSMQRYDERRLEVRLDDDSSIVASRQGSKTLRDLMD